MNKIEMLVLEDHEERIKYMRMYNPRLMWVEKAADCIEQIKTSEIEELWLDHDLGLEYYVDSNRPDCGMEVVRFLETNDFKDKIKKIYVHSHNPVNTVMAEVLRRAGYDAICYPFWKLLEQVKGE